jgi:hypothetical protein
MNTALRVLALATLLLSCSAHSVFAQGPKPFFEARGAARCTALNGWTDRIQARAPGVDLYAGVTSAIAVAYAEPSFAAAEFLPAFGKTFNQLSEGDKKAIRSSLEDCYGRATWQYGVLATGFETDPRRMDTTWRDALARIATVESAPALATAERVPPATAAPAAIEGAVPAGAPYFIFAGRPLPYANVLLNPCPNLRTTDVYFAPDVYRRLAGVAETDTRGVVDGRLIDCSFADRQLSAGDVAGAAAETFLRRLDGAGIPRTEAVRAMRDGRFNPAWEDVELAWRGMVRMSAYALPAETVAAMQRDGRWNDGSPVSEHFERAVLAQRPRAWQQQFGSYEDLPEGDFLRVLFSSLAAETSAPAAAATQYANVRADGAYGQRMAVVVSESAERRAVAEERARRMANLSEGERLMAALNFAAMPFESHRALLDQIEEAMLDEGGVLIANSGSDNKDVPSLTFCNEAGTTLRFASLIAYRSRRDSVDPLADTEYRVRGWSTLGAGQCAALRAGIDNGAFVAIQQRVGNAFIPYDVPSDEFNNVDLETVESRVVGANLQICGKRAENFFLSSTVPAELVTCGDGYVLVPFSHMVQFGQNSEYRLTVR